MINEIIEIVKWNVVITYLIYGAYEFVFFPVPSNWKITKHKMKFLIELWGHKCEIYNCQ